MRRYRIIQSDHANLAGLAGLDRHSVAGDTYAGVSSMGLNAEYAQNGGWSYGGDTEAAGWDSESGIHNNARIVGGLVNVDTELGVANAALQFVSRFTWEAPQTLLGFGASMTANHFGLVDNVSYFRGSTITTYNTEVGGAFTLGSFISGNTNGLRDHEYGHTVQSRIVGPAYLPLIAVPSFISAATSSYNQHMTRPMESTANSLSAWYLSL